LKSVQIRITNINLETSGNTNDVFRGFVILKLLKHNCFWITICFYGNDDCNDDSRYIEGTKPLLKNPSSPF